jgi:hypothetical protein
MYWYIYLGYYILSREINTNGQLIIITCQYIYINRLNLTQQKKLNNSKF